MKTLVRAVGVLCCLMTVMIGAGLSGAVAQKLKSGDKTSFEFKGKAKGLEPMPALAMEFVENVGEVQQYLDQPVKGGEKDTRQKLRDGLALDNVFIACYWLLFVGLCALLARREFALRVGGFEWRYALWLAVFAAVCATAAAISDTVENANTSALIDAREVTETLVAEVASASFLKWSLIALATLALAPVFLWSGGGWAAWAGRGLTLLYAVIGVLILWGDLSHPLLVFVGFLLNLAGVVVVAYLFTRRAEWIAEHLRRPE